MIVGNNETKFDLNRDDLHSVDFISMTSNGKGVSYIDDIKAVTDQYIEPYFSDCLKLISEPNNKKSGLGTGPIIGIVIAIVAVIAIIITIIIVVRKKKAEHNTSSNENF